MTIGRDISNYGQFGNNPNIVINGNFDIWQRNTTQTTISGYGSDDRWSNIHNGSSKTHSRQAFTVGQTDVPHNPRYFSRTVVTSSAGASNYVAKRQPIEDVTLLAGKTVVLSFWAKADASKNIAVDFTQYFGSGGSPSADVEAIGATKFALTTSWQKFTTKVTLPSISGKTLGTNGDDALRLQFWFDAGSDFNSRTDTLGQQSGTFDIAQVKLEVGDRDTPFIPRTEGEELLLCQRFFWKTYDLETLPGAVTETGAVIERASRNNSGYTIGVSFKVTMRTLPTITLYSPDTGTADRVANVSDRTVGTIYYGKNGISNVQHGVGSVDTKCTYHALCDAELQ